MIYLDSGIITKLYVQEPDSQPWRRRIQQKNDYVSSALALPEMKSALRQKVQLGALRASVAFEVWEEFVENLGDGSMRIMPVDSQVLNETVQILDGLPRKMGLKTLDAIHLATARQTPDVRIATTDRQMVIAAKYLGIPIF